MNELVDSFANRLNKAILLRNIKPIELSEKTGIDKSKISSYMSGRYKAKQDGVYLLAKALNVNEAWLMGLDVPMDRDIDRIEMNDKQVFPLLGTVKAGYDYLASENIIGYVNLDKNIQNPEEYFALTVVGDSMQPVLYEGDIVIVHSQNDLESGQIGIILINGDEATVKRIVKHDDYIELISFNSYYPPKKITKDIEFKIIGKVVEARISKIFE